MKKIINGKVYDTDTAKMVGSWDNRHPANDFAYCSEELYRKKTGEFFLHGEGGALSRYASHSGDNSGWGEEIIPLTYNAAQEWAEKHLDGDGYCAIFGEPDANSEDVTLGIRVSAAAAAKLKREASMQGITQAALLERLIMGS